jgi:hypothetical protein
MDIRPAALALVATLGLSACEGTFYTVSTNPLRTGKTITFGTALPDALEDLFHTCQDPLVLDPDKTTLDLGGTCTSTSQLPTTASQLLWIGLASQPDVDVSGLYSDDLTSALTDVYHFQGLPWPMQNCDIYIDLGGMKIKGVSLTDLASAWTTHDGKPALWVDFDQTAGAKFASGTVEGDVACPDPLNEIVIKPKLPNGAYSLSLEGLDIDIWISFSFSGSTVTASVQADVDLSGISISPALNYGDIEELLADAGYDLPTLESLVEHGLISSLHSVAQQAAAQLQATVPSGQSICSISVANGVLTMSTALVCPILKPVAL